MCYLEESAQGCSVVSGQPEASVVMAAGAVDMNEGRCNAQIFWFFY